MSEIKKKTTKKKPAKPAKKTQKVPPRKEKKPVVVLPVTDEIKNQFPISSDPVTPAPPAPVEPPKPLFTDLNVMHYAYTKVKDWADRAGYGPEGVALCYHDFDFLLKIITVSIQRSQIANGKHMELEDTKAQMRELVCPHCGKSLNLNI